MSTRAETILSTALALSPDERAWLAMELIASFEELEGENIEAIWAAEIEKRIGEVESDDAQTVSWEEARTRIKSLLAKS